MPGASAGVAGARVPGSRGQPSGRPPPPSPRDFFTLCPIPGPLTGTGSYFWKFLFFFFKCNAPRFPLATCRWSQAQGPSRCSALRDPLCSEARPCGFRAAAHHGPCCVPSACCRVPPSSPAALPRFPLPPVPPPHGPSAGSGPILRAAARRARGSQRVGSGRPQLGSHPEPRRRAPGACAALLCGSTPVSRN